MRLRQIHDCIIRYGGITAIPCSLATILAGTIGGLIYLRSGGRFCGVRTAVCFAILMEGLHMLIQLSMVQPFPVACEIVTTSTIPMIVANALGMAAFSIIVSDFLSRMKEKDAGEKGD